MFNLSLPCFINLFAKLYKFYCGAMSLHLISTKSMKKVSK